MHALARMISNPFVSILVLAASCLTGCQALNGYLENAPRPSARIVGTHLSGLNLNSADLLFDVEVSNPYATALPLSDVQYTFASASKPFLTGQAPITGSIPAKGASTISLPATVDFARLLSALQEIKPGMLVPYDAALNLSVNAPVVGKLSLPLKKSGQLPVPAVPIVELADFQWKGLDLSHGDAVIHLNITNTNQFALDLTKLSLGLNLGGHSIVSTSVAQPLSIAPGKQGGLDVPISFSPKDLGLSAFSILQGKGSNYKISGLLGADTSFGPLSLPYEKTGTTTFR